MKKLSIVMLLTALLPINNISCAIPNNNNSASDQNRTARIDGVLKHASDLQNKNADPREIAAYIKKNYNNIKAKDFNDGALSVEIAKLYNNSKNKNTIELVNMLIAAADIERDLLTLETLLRVRKLMVHTTTKSINKANDQWGRNMGSAIVYTLSTVAVLMGGSIAFVHVYNAVKG